MAPRADRNTIFDVPVATIVILALTITGCILAVIGELNFKELVATLDVPLAGLAIGRGIAARKAG